MPFPKCSSARSRVNDGKLFLAKRKHYRKTIFRTFKASPHFTISMLNGFEQCMSCMIMQGSLIDTAASRNPRCTSFDRLSSQLDKNRPWVMVEIINYDFDASQHTYNVGDASEQALLRIGHLTISHLLCCKMESQCQHRYTKSPEIALSSQEIK